MRILVFTKDRPLQFLGSLESMLFHCYPINPSNIAVILPNDQNYEGIISNPEFKGIQWLFEEKYGGFKQALVAYFNTIDDNDKVLCLCDDCVYFRYVNLNYAEMLLSSVEHAIGHSFRLGKNIDGFKKEWNLAPDRFPFYVIGWRGKPSHWGYGALELMGTVYRANIFKECVEKIEEIIVPNDLESRSSAIVAAHSNELNLMSFSKDFSALAAADLNRVQSRYPNKTEGGDQYTAEKLLELYKDGYRLNWYNYIGIVPTDCFLGLNGFQLIKQ